MSSDRTTQLAAKPTPAGVILRDYQERFVSALLGSIARGERPVGVLPTGGGKTPCAVEVIRRHGGRVLFIVHRQELLRQGERHLKAAGFTVGIIKAGYPFYASRPVQVASIQTLARRERPAADLLVFDECHHVLAKSYRKVIDAYPAAAVLGITATPWHRAGVGLGDVFSEIVVGARPGELMDAKPTAFLVEPRVFAPPAEDVAAEVKRLKPSMGDYVTSQLAKIVDKPKLIGDAVETWVKHADGRTSLYFGVSVEHSKHIAAAFNARGIRFAHVDGDTDENEREDAVGMLADGKLIGISNCGLFGEGVDVPVIKCVGLLRHTQSYSLYLQQIGRAMRPTGDGQQAVVLDHCGLTFRFGRARRDVQYGLDAGPKLSEGTGLRTCPLCFRMCDGRRARCPECGVDFTSVSTPRDAMPETVEGTLEEYRDPDAQQAAPAPVYTPEDKERFFHETYEIAAEKGWNPNAVRVRFKEKFGHWPVIVEVDGEHRLATPESGDDVKAAALVKFSAEGTEKGFKPGYAAARFKDLFGHWPRACHRAAVPAVDAGLFQKAGAA